MMIINGQVVKKDTLDYSYNPNAVINNQLTMEAILTRDQRTTSHRVVDARSDIKTSTPKAASLGVRIENVGESDKVSRSLNRETTSCENCSSQMRDSYSKRIRGYPGYRGFTVTWLRLGSLLVTLLVASIHAAPTMTSQTRTNTQGKWVNPCGQVQTENPATDGPRVGDQDYDLYMPILISTKQAIMDAEIFRDRFVETAFGLNLTKTHELWKTQEYDWLPSRKEIPKDFREPLDDEFLNKLDFDTALVDSYEYLQKYAVALEQVVWDREDLHLDFGRDFSHAEYMLRTVLCEIQMALQERQVKQRPDISRDIMPKEYREVSQKSATERNLRDWLIFRDYMNGLEFVEQVFEHLRKRIKS